MKTVLLADDHPIFRAGLRHIIEEDKAFTVVAEVGDGETCLTQAAILRPDIIVVDLSMPGKNGFEVAEWTAQNLPLTRTIIVSMHSSKEFVHKGISSGAYAFVAKEDASTELMVALRSTEPFLMSASAGSDVINTFGSPGQNLDEVLTQLTSAELTVLRMIAAGRTSPQIASSLGVSPRTVQTHRQNMSPKLGLKGANSLIGFALQNRDEIDRFA